MRLSGPSGLLCEYRVDRVPVVGIAKSLLRWRGKPVVGGLARQLLQVYGCDIPAEVVIGERFELGHRGMGTVMHPRVTIGDDVTVYHGVTIGRSHWGGGHVYIGNRAVLSVGCVVLGGEEDRHIGEGAIVGANAVVTKDVPPWEIWAGVPARRIGQRDPSGPSAW